MQTLFYALWMPMIAEAAPACDPTILTLDVVLEAPQLLEAGRACLEGHRPEAAVPFLRAALGMDEKSAEIHYTLAVALANVATNLRCEHGATRPAVLDHLTRAIALDRNIGRRLPLEPSFNSLHGMVRYRLLTGETLATDAGIEAMLVDTQFFSTPYQGFNGQLLQFRSGGNASVDLLGEEAYVYMGSWKVSKHQVHLEAGGEKHTLVVTADGSLLENGKVTWVEAPDECGSPAGEAPIPAEVPRR